MEYFQLKALINKEEVVKKSSQNSFKVYDSRVEIFNKDFEKIKILFVSSGNLKNFDLAPFIKVQGDSLATEGVDVKYFKIVGKGFFGYLSNIKNLKKFLKENEIDIIHAHFTLSAWIAVLAFSKKPIVLSLMGIDAFGRINKFNKTSYSNKLLTILTFFIQPFVSYIISKSPNIDKYVWKRKNSLILPNGVDLQKFNGNRVCYKKELGLKEEVKYILFLGNKDDLNKNFSLLKETEDKLKELGFEIIAPYPVNHLQIPKYLSTVDILVMCSFQEGSPNVVKEAMASNCKGVFTDVGDVKNLVDNVNGYSICNFNPDSLINSILKVDQMENCGGRERIISLGLNLENIAKKLRMIYLNLV